MSDFRKIDEKLDKIDSSITRIDITLAKQHESLKDHMRRTHLLEQSLKPVEKHVAMVNGALKFIGILAMIMGIIESIIMMVKK